MILRKPSWHSAIFAAAILAIVVSVAVDATAFVRDRSERAREIEARLTLPQTSAFWSVNDVDLRRASGLGESMGIPDGELVIYTDAHARQEFEGRFKVALRDRETFRHAWTPFWSHWIDYTANPNGTRYRQPEGLRWWSDAPEWVEIDHANGWLMETCWQARVDDPVLGLTELEPVCVTIGVGREQQRTLGKIEQLTDEGEQ